MAEDFDTAIAKVQQDWLGHVRSTADEVSPSMMRRIAAMLDHDPDGFPRGAPLPRHWFTMFCCESARQSDIGPDGHPNKGVILPPIPLARRMGAGRRVTIPGEVRVGDPLVKHAEVAAISPKLGRTGQICVLTLRCTFESNGRIIAVDEFDAIYREAVTPGAKSPTNSPAMAPTDGAWAEPKHLASPLVFRYSAVTWNAHRIHYDADYTRDAEGYPATVQNGGLTMQLLLDAAVKNAPGQVLTGFTARLARPIYVGDTVTFAGSTVAAGRMTAWVADKDGYLCAQAALEFG